MHGEGAMEECILLQYCMQDSIMCHQHYECFGPFYNCYINHSSKKEKYSIKTYNLEQNLFSGAKGSL